MSPGPLTRAAQYLRMSTDEQVYSLAIQADLIARYAALNGLQVVRSYEDAGKSGVSAQGREGLRALIRDVMDGPDYTTLLVLDVSRWGRFQDPDEAGHFEFLCRSAGVSVRYCAECFDDDAGVTSSVMKTLKRAMAAEFSRQLSDRIRHGRRLSAEAGLWVGGYPPYGFARQAFDRNGRPDRILRKGDRRPNDQQVVRVVPGPPAEVEAVRAIFRMFVEERLGPGAIAETLNRRGAQWRDGRPWTDARVRSVLGNELCIGVLAYSRTTWALNVRVRRNAPQDWRRVKALDPIVDPALFALAQERLSTGARGPRSQPSRAASLDAS